MKNNKKVIAGIVTYNPDFERLRKNVLAIKSQVEQVLIVDNNSTKRNLLKAFEVDNIKVIFNNKNLGIAAALNTIMKCCEKLDCEWAITLDQDSICPSEYIKIAQAAMNMDNVGQIVPILYESNTNRYYLLSDKLSKDQFQIVHKSITSAAITNYKAWKEIGGFDEGLFIDYVDYDYAFRIQKKGYKIVRINTVKLDHHMGDSELHGIGPLKVRVANHSAFRKYYITRNMIVFMRRYKIEGHLFAEILRLFKMISLMLLFEKNKGEKVKAVWKGIIDGFAYNV